MKHEILSNSVSRKQCDTKLDLIGGKCDVKTREAGLPSPGRAKHEKAQENKFHPDMEDTPLSQNMSFRNVATSKGKKEALGKDNSKISTSHLHLLF